MARSKRYVELLTRLTELRRHFLPTQFDPTQPYSRRQYDRVASYRVLAHAEFESCIEDLVINAAVAAWSGYRADGKARTCLMALVAYYDGKLGRPPDTFPPHQQATQSLAHLPDRLQKAYSHHVYTVVQSNHGIREKNLLRLLLPVGVVEGDINKTWLATIDSFGLSRGDTAHQSGRTQQPLDPQVELGRVKAISVGLKDIDAVLRRLGT